MKHYFFYRGIHSSSTAALMITSRLTKIRTHTTLLANQQQHRPFWYSSQTITEQFWEKSASKTITYGPSFVEIVSGASEKVPCPIMGHWNINLKSPCACLTFGHVNLIFEFTNVMITFEI